MNEDRSLPTTASFHPDVIDRYVRRKISFGNPFTFFGPVVGLAFASFGFAYLQFFDPWMLIAAGGGVGVGLGSFLLDVFVRKDTIRMGYLKEVNRQLETQASDIAAWLEQEYDQLDHAKGKSLVERLSRQMEAFEEILSDKFPPGTETHEHFKGVAEALLIQTLNCLKDAVSQLRANQAIDLEYAQKMVKKTSGAEQEGHQRKLTMYADGTTHLEELLSSAETAVTGIAELGHKVAKVTSGNTADFKSFLEEAQSLAERAGFYRDERSL